MNVFRAILSSPYTIEFQETAIPSILDDEVLIKVISLGICGSDIQMYHGMHKYMTYPVVPGHEVSAIVEKTGAKISDFKPGDRVTVEPQIYCGECYPCQIGRFNVCEKLRVKGVHADGFAAEHVVIKPTYLHLCPTDMDFDRITLVEPLAVGVGSIKRSNYKGANVAVIGAGTIGNLIAQAAQALGAAKVMVTDILDTKLEYADKCGIECCINTKDVTLVEAIDRVFGKRKADVIIDAAASRSSLIAALEASRSSSEIIITGNYKHPMELEIPRLQRREVSLIGHMMYVREDYADAIRFLTEGTVKTKGFITQRFGFKDYDAAFKFIDDHPNDIMKAVIDIT